MTDAHSEAIIMATFTVVWLLVSALSFRPAHRTGQRSQWRYVALFGAAVGLTLMILNLRGYAFSGPGFDITQRPH